MKDMDFDEWPWRTLQQKVLGSCRGNGLQKVSNYSSNIYQFFVALKTVKVDRLSVFAI